MSALIALLNPVIPQSMRDLPGRRHVMQDDMDDTIASRHRLQYEKDIDANRARKRDDYERRREIIAEQRRINRRMKNAK